MSQLRRGEGFYLIAGVDMSLPILLEAIPTVMQIIPQLKALLIYSRKEHALKGPILARTSFFFLASYFFYLLC